MAGAKRSDVIRIGVAGLGRSGWKNHAQRLAAMGDRYRLVAVMDPNPRVRSRAEATFGCRAYAEFEPFIADDELDVVTIATPSHLHVPQAIQAMEAGRDVVCEKPMAPTLAEADGMLEAANRTSRLLTVFQNRRFMPDLLQIREVIESGDLGRIIKITCRVQKFTRRWDWQTLQAFGGGELNNSASHFVDEVLQLAGDGDARVFCHRVNALSAGDAEDTLTIVMDIPGSPLLEVEVSSCAAYADAMWHVQGTRGGLIGSLNELRWKTSNVDELPPRQVERQPAGERGSEKDAIQWGPEQTWRMPDDAKMSQDAFYEALHDTLRRGAPLAVTPESVRRTIEVLERCREQCPLPEAAVAGQA